MPSDGVNGAIRPKQNQIGANNDTARVPSAALPELANGLRDREGTELPAGVFSKCATSELRITPQFSRGVLPPVPWHFMHDRRLQLLVMRLAQHWISAPLQRGV
jgi:hypothetical protein